MSGGADVHCVDSDGDTPLFVAALKGHAGVIRVLLRCGADPNCRRRSGSSALHAACQ